jgi:hypothetical protein
MGLTFERLADEIEAAIDPADRALWEQVNRDIDEVAKALPDDISDEAYLRDSHGIIDWVCGLANGWWALPDRLPRAFLQFFADDFAKEKETYKVWKSLDPGRRLCTARIFQRCEDCRMGLPYRGGGFSECPACGSHELWYLDLSRPEVVFTDGKGNRHE